MREGVAALPYTDFVFSRWQYICAGGHGGPPLRGGFPTKAPVGAGFHACPEYRST